MLFCVSPERNPLRWRSNLYISIFAVNVRARYTGNANIKELSCNDNCKPGVPPPQKNRRRHLLTLYKRNFVTWTLQNEHLSNIKT